MHNYPACNFVNRMKNLWIWPFIKSKIWILSEFYWLEVLCWTKMFSGRQSLKEKSECSTTFKLGVGKSSTLDSCTISHCGWDCKSQTVSHRYAVNNCNSLFMLQETGANTCETLSQSYEHFEQRRTTKLHNNIQWACHKYARYVVI